MSDRFVAHAAARLDGLDESATVLAIVDPAAPYEDTLPNRPARWLYRLRRVDAAGRPSANAQVLSMVVHVPSPARSVAPELKSLEIEGTSATVRVKLPDGNEASVYVFHTADNSLGTAIATLATVRNRPDLPADAQLIVRDELGRRLGPTPVALDPTGTGTVTFALPTDGIVLHVWAVSITADGVPSRLIGPLHAALSVSA